MLEFFQGLTTKHIVLGSIVAIYLLGVFALRFWCGFCSRSSKEIDDTDSLMIWWWPLIIPGIIVDAVTDFSRWLIKKFPKTSHKLHCVWKGIVTVVDYATLPLRPFTFGQRIANRNKKEKN